MAWSFFFESWFFSSSNLLLWCTKEKLQNLCHCPSTYGSDCTFKVSDSETLLCHYLSKILADTCNFSSDHVWPLIYVIIASVFRTCQYFKQSHNCAYKTNITKEITQNGVFLYVCKLVPVYSHGIIFHCMSLRMLKKTWTENSYSNIQVYVLHVNLARTFFLEMQINTNSHSRETATYSTLTGGSSQEVIRTPGVSV